MLSRWQGGTAAVVVTLLTCALVIVDVADSASRRWWDGHAVTTDTVSGLLVLLITVLVVDQVVRRRQVSDRSRAVAAQAAIMDVQARRTVQAVTQAVAQGASDSDRDAASDELRTYMMMLLVAAPVLIDVPVSRSVLEQAQSLGGEMARVLAAAGRQKDGAAISTDRLDDAVKRLRAASDPLLQVLDPETRTAALGGDSELSAARGACGRLGCGGLWGVMGCGEVATQQEIGTPMTADAQSVYAAAFSGATLATAGSDGTSRTWDVAFPASLTQAACAIADVSLTRQQWAGYAGTHPFQQVCPAS